MPSASIDGVVSGAIQDLDYARAAAVLRASAPPDLIPGAADSRRSAAVRLEDALDGAAARPRDPEVLADLARALLASGFAGEAVTVGARALAESPGSAALQELFAAAASWRTLLMAVERTVELHYRRSGDSTDLSGLLAELGGLSERVLGEDIFSDLPIVRFPLVGAVTRTDAPGAPEIWSERGVLLVLGYRSGVGVEGTMARLVLRCESVELEGGPHDVAFVRGVRLASRTERSGSAVGGFTLPGWLAVDLDVADRGAGEVRRIAGNAARWEAEAQWPAAGRDEQLSLWFPGDIRGRLARRLEDPRRAVLAATLAHERGHVLDVRRYFPFLPHLPEILLGFARAGFSPARAEVELERAAERRALLSSENRTAALLNTLGALPFRDDAPPHSIAYAELVDEIVATLGDNLGSYPAIDPGLNLLQQLDRLSEAELADLLDRALR